jgi:hypothetical protein
VRFVGKYGEYQVLAYLLEQDVEAYLAIAVNQPDFDITAILDDKSVVRIQVKSTELNNKSTNNSINRIDKKYDFLVVVIIADDMSARFFIMTKAEAIALKGGNKQLGVAQQRNKVFQVKENLLPYENKWGTILNTKRKKFRSA